MDICSRQSFPGQFSMVFSWIWFKNFQPRDETSQSDAVKLGLWALPEQRLFTLVEGHRREEFGHFKVLFFLHLILQRSLTNSRKLGKLRLSIQGIEQQPLSSGRFSLTLCQARKAGNTHHFPSFSVTPFCSV